MQMSIILGERVQQILAYLILTTWCLEIIFEGVKPDFALLSNSIIKEDFWKILSLLIKQWNING